MIKKYPNLKIYSVYKLLNDYCTQYKKILSEPEEEEKVKDKKKKKKREIETITKEEKLKAFEPVLTIIKPYLQLEENYSNVNNTNLKNKESIIIPQDEVLLKLLIQ